jgi:phage replication-related protein YjqB (UPF0714/DUF867 family)
MMDRYGSFSDLAGHEVEGRDYRVRTLVRPLSPVILIAPHGGSIEGGTSELAELIAGSEHNLFSFEGLKPQHGDRELHITSHRFDHPAALTMLARCPVAVAVHGCRGKREIHVGGLDLDLRDRLASSLKKGGFAASAEGHRYPGKHPMNVCNRTSRGRGAQLELTVDLRLPPMREVIAGLVAGTLAGYLRSLALP